MVTIVNWSIKLWYWALVCNCCCKEAINLVCTTWEIAIATDAATLKRIFSDSLKDKALTDQTNHIYLALKACRYFQNRPYRQMLPSS